MKKLIPLFLCLICLCGCGKQEEKYQKNVLAMDTVMTMTAYGTNGEAALEAAEDLITQLDAEISYTSADSETSAVNNGGGSAVEVSPRFFDLVKSSLELCSSTDGILDVTLTPVIEAWGFIGESYRIPEASELSELLKNVDYSEIVLDEEASTVTVPASMAVSFGSTAKGYTGDLLAQCFRQQGVTSAIVSLGGNVQAVGLKPDGSKWKVAIQNPFGDGNYALVEVENKAVVTSGGYQRYFEQDGKTYWHIIDPETGCPADSGLASVTIVCDKGVTADGLSTALFVMGEEKAEAYWRKHRDFDFIIIARNGDVYVTPGIEESFTISEAFADCCVSIVE